MTSSPGLHELIRLQARRGMLQTTTDDDDRRVQTTRTDVSMVKCARVVISFVSCICLTKF